jgi:hypothetical protein
MSHDPDSPYEDEYFEETGRQELIAQALKDVSEDGIRQYLGIHGDAIDTLPVQDESCSAGRSTMLSEHNRCRCRNSFRCNATT